MYHLDDGKGPACGAKSKDLVPRPLMADCHACRLLGGLKDEDTEAVEVIVAEPPPLEELLGKAIALLCEAAPDDRRALVEKALAAIEGRL